VITNNARDSQNQAWLRYEVTSDPSQKPVPITAASDK